jgi:hypothetical protein
MNWQQGRCPSSSISTALSAEACRKGPSECGRKGPSSSRRTAQSAEVCRKSPSEDRKGPSTSRQTALSLPERPLLRDTENSAEACRKGPSSGTRTAQSAEACRKGPSEDRKGPSTSRQTALRVPERPLLRDTENSAEACRKGPSSGTRRASLSAEACRKGPQDPGHGAVESSGGEEASDIQSSKYEAALERVQPLGGQSSRHLEIHRKSQWCCKSQQKPGAVMPRPVLRKHSGALEAQLLFSTWRVQRRCFEIKSKCSRRWAGEGHSYKLAIGARTSPSRPMRQIASGAVMPRPVLRKHSGQIGARGAE